MGTVEFSEIKEFYAYNLKKNNLFLVSSLPHAFEFVKLGLVLGTENFSYSVSGPLARL